MSRERLSEIESFAVAQQYEQGQVVFQNNEPARNLYALSTGEVDLAILFKEEVVTKELWLTERISSIIAKRLNSRTDKLVEAWCIAFDTGQITTV